MSPRVRKASLTLGVMSIVGGLCAVAFGLTGQSVYVSGWGPFDGPWDAEDYHMLGTIFLVGGSGLFTFALLDRGRAVSVE